MILSELVGTVRITTEGTNQSLLGNVYLAENEDSYELNGDVEFDIAYNQQVHPTGITPQFVSIALEIEGYGIIPPTKLINGISWERDIEAGAKISFAVDRTNSPIGNEIQWKGPPPGIKNITLWGAYIVNGIPKWSKLITGGISDFSNTKINSKERLITITILDPFYRHVSKKVNYTLKQGHKKTPQQVIKDILELMNVDNVVIDNGTIQRVKPIDIVCQPGLSHCKEQADSIAKLVYFDKEANVRLISKGFDSTLVESQLFTETSILDLDDFNIDSAGGEVPTRILVTGEVSSVSDCGLRTVTTEYILEEEFAPRGASKTQDTGGGINVYGLVLPVLKRIRRKIIRELTYSCNTLIVEKIMTFEWKNLRTWRYVIDGNVAGDIIGWNFGYFMDEVPDASSELYFWPEEKFVQVSEVTNYFDYSNGQGLAFNGEWLYPPIASNYRSRTVYSGYRLLQSALKTNIADPTLPWEQTIYIDNKKITGGHDGVSDNHIVEEYFGDLSSQFGVGFANGYLQNDILVNSIRDDGYITKDQKVQYGIRVVPGGSYLYNGSDLNTSKYEDEQVLNSVLDEIILDHENLILSEENIYAAEDENSGLQTIKTTVDYKFDPPKVVGPETQYSDNYLPFATFMQAHDSNISTQSFEFTIEAPVLLISHPEFEKTLSNSLVESEEEATVLAVSELRENSALTCSFPVPFNIPIDCGKVVRVYLRRSGINEKVFVRNVSGSWNGIGNGPIVTKVTGKIYVI